MNKENSQIRKTHKISEHDFSTQVFDLLNIYQWRWCHIRPAFTNKGYRTPIQGHDPDGFKGKGLPDIIAIRPPRLLFIELKDQYAKPSPEQEAWLNDLKRCNLLQGIDTDMIEVYLWRPDQLEVEILEVLK